MKNLIIAGSCRAGKSLLAKEMAKKIKGLSYYNTDHIRTGLKAAWPDKNFDKEYYDKYRTVVYNLYKWFTAYNKLGLYILMEGNHFSLEEFLKLYDDGSTIIVLVGRPQLSWKEYYKLIRENEKKFGGWTKKHSDEEVMGFAKRYLEKSIKQENQVKELKRKDVLYLDTSFNQMEKIKKFAVKLDKLLHKN